MADRRDAHIDELLDRAIGAVNRGDLATAHNLAEVVLREDATNRDAEELLAAEATPSGELRRLTILCSDLVGSTELAERQDPERYWALVRHYRAVTREILEDHYEGHIVTITGDGFFTVFGHPVAHEDDTLRAVRAGLELCAAVRDLSEKAHRAVGESLEVRVGIHRGLVFLDTEEDDVYGLAANLASRIEGQAAPGTVMVTEEVLPLLGGQFDLVAEQPRHVKGITTPVRPSTVVRERPGHAVADPAVPLVGRRRELGVLREAWDAASRRREPGSADVLVRGEPGIGKSRLVRALADEVQASGAPVVELAGSPLHAGTGFHPVRELLEVRAGIDADTDTPERLRRLRAELGDPERSATLVPLLAPVLGLPPSAGYQPVAEDGRKLDEDITAAALDYLLGSFPDGRGLLVVEDAQWVDPSTWRLVAELAARGPGGVLVLLTARDEVPQEVDTVIELEPLGENERLELVDALVGDDLAPGDRRALADRSDGVPLYLEALAQVATDGDGPAGGGAAHPDADGDGTRTPDEVPDVLYELLAARLLATDEAASLAGAAATLGRHVRRGRLEQLVEQEPATVDRSLASLVDAGVLVPTGDDDTYRFRHELVRRVAYDLQPPASRRHHEGRAADLLVAEADCDDVIDWSVAARHYEHARRHDEAIDAWARAAERARRRGALGESRSHLGRAIEVLDGLPHDRSRDAREVDLRLRRGFLAMSAESVGSGDAASDYERCLELALDDAQSDTMFASLISLWAYYLSRGELSRSRQVSEALRRGVDGDRSAFGPSNRAGFGILDWFEGRFEAAADTLEAAVGDVDDVRGEADAAELWFVPNDPTVSIHTHTALARFLRGDLAGADAEMARSAEISAALGFPQGPWSAAYTRWLRSWMMAERGAFDEAATDAAAVLDHGSGHGFDGWTAIGMTQLAAVALAASLASLAAGAEVDPEQLAAETAALADLVDVWQVTEMLVFVPHYLTLVGAGLAASGDTDGAAQRYDDADELADRTGMAFYAAETARRRALLAPSGDERAAGLRRALGLARAQGARPFELRAVVDLAEVVGADADPELRAAVDGFSPGPSFPELDAARALTAVAG